VGKRQLVQAEALALNSHYHQMDINSKQNYYSVAHKIALQKY